MAYYVAKYPKYPDAWRVVWRKYEKDEKNDSYRARVRHVPETEYIQLGIRKSMSINEARDIIKKLNIEHGRMRHEERRNNISRRLKEESQTESVNLPKAFVDKFENDHLATRYIENDERLKKVLKLWRSGQRILRTLTRPVEEWHRYPEPIYAYFVKRATSPGYAKNILSILNMWIDFLGVEQGKFYRPVPTPNPTWQSRINDAFEEADKSKQSLPITPEMLKGVKPPLKEEQFNWVFCTVWAGLRPNEASSLLNRKRTRITYLEGTPILEVYQSKLKNVPNSKDRWKRIPLFLPEQKKIIEIIDSGKIEEPLAKTLSGRFGRGHTLYGGRKGFHELMVTRYGQIELEVVRWLGHKSLDMAMKHYAKKDAVRWTPLKKAG